MTDERKRVPVKQDYLHALGESLYCFARLEWDAAWCLEKLNSGFIATRDIKKVTAGVLARKLLKAAEEVPDDKLYKAVLAEAALRFAELVDTRNQIFHGTPHTDSDGEQRLGANGHTWTPLKLENASDEFTKCSLTLNDLLHKRLTNTTVRRA